MIKIYNPTKRPVDKNIIKTINGYKNDLNLVVSHGGDGTLLGAEREFPSIPKLAIRSSNICTKCYRIDDLQNILESIRLGHITPHQYIKLEASFNNKKLIALNEINIKCSHPNLALRFSYALNDQSFNNIIADGIIVSTVFGSSGYFKSITRTVFYQGIGVAVINPTELLLNQIVADENIISITINRENAFICADNNPKIYTLKAGDIVTIQKSPNLALIY